jgi:hypothetical protein
MVFDNLLEDVCNVATVFCQDLNVYCILVKPQMTNHRDLLKSLIII